eukprot:CAMPEP_0181414258 /NCGR_PEP_ID=MMETSP1110-20121109/9416_1 /TAXON_ID=174948 /ORGANISM="Symbiodinium sp., Strain CCMP421" /LENGTH=115 /DNA_ID=CAMNT_0023537139 /DNA_START=1211 /DNA_END=1558 /DNA_ORIENTATION=-
MNAKEVGHADAHLIQSHWIRHATLKFVKLLHVRVVLVWLPQHTFGQQHGRRGIDSLAVFLSGVDFSLEGHVRKGFVRHIYVALDIAAKVIACPVCSWRHMGAWKAPHSKCAQVGA